MFNTGQLKKKTTQMQGSVKRQESLLANTEKANLPPKEALQQYTNNVSFTEWSSPSWSKSFPFTQNKKRPDK